MRNDVVSPFLTPFDSRAASRRGLWFVLVSQGGPRNEPVPTLARVCRCRGRFGLHPCRAGGEEQSQTARAEEDAGGESPQAAPRLRRKGATRQACRGQAQLEEAGRRALGQA